MPRNRLRARPRLRRAALLPALLAPVLTVMSPTVYAQVIKLGTLGGSYSFATSITPDGTIVVGAAQDASGNYRVFRWTESGGMEDLGIPLGGTYAGAAGISADGSVIIGTSKNDQDEHHAFLWTPGQIRDLGTLGGSESWAWGVSADGTVVVGETELASGEWRAFRWTDADGMQNLGTLGGDSWAIAVSADGKVVVGGSTTNDGHDHAFRWTEASNTMRDLGTLGGDDSYATGVSADGSVVVGDAQTGSGAWHAFRWTEADDKMHDLGTLGGSESWAYAVSANGKVVVGSAETADGSHRAFRWTEATGMQSVENWLRSTGVKVPADIETHIAYATSADGRVVVGMLENNTAFLARGGSGLVTVESMQQSLSATASGGAMALASASTVLNGAHSRPLARRVEAGRSTFWISGDIGRDDHGKRDGRIGLAEVGFGRNFGNAQLNVALGHTWAKQNLVVNGSADTDGTYVLAEGLVPVSGSLWAVLTGYLHWGKADLRRGYLNAGLPDYSYAKPDTDTWGLRARLEWDGLWRSGNTAFSPYAELAHSVAKMDGYTETGGGFPARFDSRKERATELRLGVNAAHPLAQNVQLVGLLEGAHRFQKKGARTSGEVIGLFGFDLDGVKNERTWLRAGVGVEGKLAGGTASLLLNATTKGEASNYWLAASWQKTF